MRVKIRPEEKIYKAYFDSKEKKLYFNQLKELTGLSNSSLQNILNKLIEKELIEIEKRKSNTFYKIRKKKIFALKFSEIAINKFDKLNISVRAPLNDFLKEIPIETFTIVLFGSAARKEEQEESDIDLLIVSEKEYDLEPLRERINAISNYPLNIFRCKPQDFIKNKDPVIIQAKKKGFPIYKEQNFYEVLLNEHRGTI